MINFLAHYFSSHTRHGTHSPFVYALADKVIYNKNYQRNNHATYAFGAYDGKCTRLLRSILHFLQVENIFFATYCDHDNINSAVLKSVEKIQLADLQNLSSYKVLILFDLYKNRRNQKEWRRIQASNEVDVTIDLYYFGLVFHRPQQSKQNFKLKYPFWI